MMKLDSVPEVLIDSRRGRKFIVAIVSDKNKQNKIVVRANLRKRRHYNLFTDLKETLRPFDFAVQCIGGGHIMVNPEAKTIHIWGKSLEFNFEPNRQETATLLQK